VLRVRTALTRLPWVDQDKVEANVDIKQVRITVTDPKRYDDGQLQQALQAQGFKSVKLSDSLRK
jgi:hypothetical protein